MNKAFIFDMDGVLIDSERVWNREEGDYLEKIFGKEVSDKIGETVGVNITEIYNQAIKNGSSLSKKDYQQKLDIIAFSVYRHAILLPNIHRLGTFLQQKGFLIGLVSSSPLHWIHYVLPRIPFRDSLAEIISVDAPKVLRPKPYSDGYHAMMKKLHVKASETIILEDSNAGITAAKNSGAFTIAFTQFLIEAYQQREAVAKAHNVEDIINIVRERI